MALDTQIREGAAEIRRLHQLIGETYADKKRRDEWREVCSTFHETYDQHAFPGGLDRGMAALKNGDRDARNAAILFLEEDPMFFRSGYIKEEIIQRLKQFELTPREIDRIHAAILNVVANRHCRELRRYRSLATRFATEGLV